MDQLWGEDPLALPRYLHGTPGVAVGGRKAEPLVGWPISPRALGRSRVTSARPTWVPSTESRGLRPKAPERRAPVVCQPVGRDSPYGSRSTRRHRYRGSGADAPESGLVRVGCAEVRCWTCGRGAGAGTMALRWYYSTAPMDRRLAHRRPPAAPSRHHPALAGPAGSAGAGRGPACDPWGGRGLVRPGVPRKHGGSHADAPATARPLGARPPV
jgi:hypothetical protein